jgi:hypothetical protein
MTWFKDWLKTSADRLAANLREAGWPSSSDPVVTPEGMMPEPRRFSTTGLDLANLSNTDRDWALNHIITECKHPGIQVVRFPNGETSHHCALCAKTWSNLAEAVDDAEQTQPISMTVVEEGGIPAAVEQLASELSQRLGESVAQLVAATSPEGRQTQTQTPFMRQPLQLQEGGQTQNINMQDLDGLAGVRSRVETRLAQQEARNATKRRNAAMEDAARAAAAAFDAGIEAERNPVKLDGDRKLKAI